MRNILPDDVRTALEEESMDLDVECEAADDDVRQMRQSILPLVLADEGIVFDSSIFNLIPSLLETLLKF